MPCGFCLNGNVQHRLLWMVSVSVYIFWGPKEKILMCIFFGPKGNILVYIFFGGRKEIFQCIYFWGAERKILAYIFSGAERKDFIPRKRASHGFLIRQEKKKKILKWQGSLQFQPMKKGTSPFDSLWMKARKFCNNFSISFATYCRLAP